MGAKKKKPVKDKPVRLHPMKLEEAIRELFSLKKGDIKEVKMPKKESNRKGKGE